MTRRCRHHLILLGFLLILSLSTGCLNPENVNPARAPQRRQLTQEELRLALEDFDSLFEANVKQAANELDKLSPERATRMNTLTWKIQAIRACDTTLGQKEVVKAFLDTWTLCVRLRQYFEDGDGKNMFGQHQAIAVNASRAIENDIERVGELFLAQGPLAKAKQEIDTFTRAHPITGQFTGILLRWADVQKDQQLILNTLLAVPLAPFRVFEGIDKGAAAIHGFTDVAARFADIVQEWPESMSWELQLMLFKLSEYEFVRSALASMEKFATSSEQLAGTVRELPEEIRRQAAQLLDDIDERQASIQQTLVKAEQTALRVEQALRQVDTSAQAVEATAQSVTSAGQAWTEVAKTVADISRESTTRRGDQPATQPFDINDYRATADSLTAAATEIHQLTGEIRELIESPVWPTRLNEVDTRVQDTVQLTARQVETLSTHIVRQLAGLVVLIFVLAVVYRILSARIGRPRS